MQKAHPEIMSAEEAVLYLRSRIGDIAPAAETLKTWSMPSHRSRHPETVKRLSLPAGVAIEGMKQRAWLRESLDTYADTIIAEVRRLVAEVGAADEGDG